MYTNEITNKTIKSMKLKFISASNKAAKAKATIHKTGKLGFSIEAVSYLNLSEGLYIRFAQNEEDENDLNLYAQLTNEVSEESFKIIKAGQYFYVNTKVMFDDLGEKYVEKKIIYDIVKIDIEGEEILKLMRREIKKKKKEVGDK